MGGLESWSQSEVRAEFDDMEEQLPFLYGALRDSHDELSAYNRKTAEVYPNGEPASAYHHRQGLEGKVSEIENQIAEGERYRDELKNRLHWMHRNVR